jgi:GDP-4-dehydro-6-deoxy-D-mannose reductase
VRDFLHVADVADAYCLLAERGVAGEVYNVSSGTGWSVRALAELVMRAVGVEVTLEQDEELVRRVDVPMLVGDATKLRGATGWVPSHSVSDIVEELTRAAA